VFLISAILPNGRHHLGKSGSKPTESVTWHASVLGVMLAEATAIAALSKSLGVSRRVGSKKSSEKLHWPST
jgi:hypothetical protein